MCPTTFEEAIPWILTFVTVAGTVGATAAYFAMKGFYENDERKDSK